MGLDVNRHVFLHLTLDLGVMTLNFSFPCHNSRGLHRSGKGRGNEFFEGKGIVWEFGNISGKNQFWQNIGEKSGKFEKDSNLF